jgi:hypothetical protein
VPKRQTITKLKEILKAQFHPEVSEGECTFGLVVLLTHWSDVVQFALAAESERVDVIVMQRFSGWNFVASREALTPVPLQDGLFLFVTDLTFQGDSHFGFLSSLHNRVVAAKHRTAHFFCVSDKPSMA